ncbi:hypothetical protein ACFXA3_19930, partial [Streptomyces sp. NPDC059456]
MTAAGPAREPGRPADLRYPAVNPGPHEEERPVPHEPQPQSPDELDAEAVRTWSSLAVAALGRAREDIDAINVYPVADADTGTNLYLTAEEVAALAVLLTARIRLRNEAQASQTEA